MTLVDVGLYFSYALLAGCGVGLLGIAVLYGYWRLTEPHLNHSYYQCAAVDCSRHVKHNASHVLLATGAYCSVKCFNTEFRAGRV